MRNWLVKDARAHFSDVIEGALAGEPQRVARRGKEAVVVVAEHEWKRLAKPRAGLTLGQYLATYPLDPKDFDIAGGREKTRPNYFVED